jgi:AcrR family transcriptional regulator
MNSAESEVEPAGDASDSAVLTLLAGSSKRKASSRQRLMTAAMTEFADNGYLATSVEDIVASANLSRMTFYRHFKGKADLALDLFHSAAEVSTPRFLEITELDYRSREVVCEWIARVFSGDQQNRLLLRVFTQATSEQDGFAERAQEYIATVISALGEAIPAFAVDRNEPSQRRRWLEAWLLVYEILDQSNHAALASGIANDPAVIDILTDRFVNFVAG